MSRLPERRRRTVFAAIYGAAILGLTVPVLPAVWSGAPLILGLPPALLWVTFWLVVVFGLVLWLYRTEPADGATPTRGSFP